MLKEYVVIDNFFDNPEDVRDMALHHYKYYDQETHPDPDHMQQFPGIRTNYIDRLDTNLSRFIIEQQAAIGNFIANNSIDWDNPNNRVWNTFSLTFKDLNKRLPQWHQDYVDPTDNLCDYYYGGVVYLNKNVRKGRGTSIKLSSGEVVNVENKFNRFVLYDSRLKHTITRSFGTNKKNGRLVMTQFIGFNLKR